MKPAPLEKDYKQSEEPLSLLQTISMEVAAAGDLASALEVVLREVCEKTGWVIGQAWMPNADATVLDLVAAWYRGDGELKPFKAASEASHFEPGIGLPGRVWKSKQPAWVEDVINDPNFPRSAAARGARLKTGVAIPILSRRKVIALLEFFMRESRSQNEQLVNVIVAVAAHDGAETGCGATLGYERNSPVHFVEYGRRSYGC
jgi:signal transduction protein with GAF and PtsI domain